MSKKFLSNDDIHAIMNQMEVTVSMRAEELADLIVEKKIRAEQRAFESLKQKVLDATSRMIADMSNSSEFDLTDDDLMALSDVTDRLRDLGYKFAFVEVQNSSGEILKHKLRVSVAHLTK